jgi:hypothetical protein
MNRQRFRCIRPLTDDHFYEDSETGLLMLISCLLPEDEHQAELARRSEALIERLAIKVAGLAGRRPTADGDREYVDQVQRLSRELGARQAKRQVAERIAADHNITYKAAQERLNRAMRKGSIAA